MLFNILQLFGLDVPAKVAAAKSVIEQRAAAIIATFSAVDGVLLSMAAGVGCSPFIGLSQKATGSTPDWASLQGSSSLPL